MANLHGPRAHEQRHVTVNRLIVQQTSRASRLMLRVGRVLRSRWRAEQDDDVVGGM